MNAVTSWSYSSYDLHNQCPLKYKLEKIDKIPTPTPPATFLAKLVATSRSGRLKYPGFQG